MKQIYWLGDHDPAKIEQYLKIPLWEFWIILSEKLSILEKQKVKKKY